MPPLSSLAGAAGVAAVLHRTDIHVDDAFDVDAGLRKRRAGERRCDGRGQQQLDEDGFGLHDFSGLSYSSLKNVIE